MVASGTFADPYTGTTISFVRGNTTSTAVQIDHVVALSDAWQKGAQQLTADERRQLANDPLNLFAADGPANGAKSDSDAATWLPSNKAFRCEYVARQTAVKAEYRLWMTQAEHDAIAAVLASCPDEPVPAREGTASRTAPASVAARRKTLETREYDAGLRQLRGRQGCRRSTHPSRRSGLGPEVRRRRRRSRLHLLTRISGHGTVR